MSELTPSLPPAEDDMLIWFEQLRRQLDKSRQRMLVSAQGSQQYCDLLAHRLVSQQNDVVILSNRPMTIESTPFSNAAILLGREFQIAIVDLFNGLNPDVIAIAGGLVKSAGILLLLSPMSSSWRIADDQYAVWQNNHVSQRPIFVDYFFNKIEQNLCCCLRLIESRPLPRIPELDVLEVTGIVNGETTEQTKAIRSVINWLQVSEPRMALITANRGRGKSTCLGLIAEQLMHGQNRKVCATACSRRAADRLLAQIDSIDFHSPDALIENPVVADVLFIDEAAMLPYPMLAQLCGLYRQVVMATTTGGYEGTGQGFLLRFVARLPADQLLRINIHHPVRWSIDDGLEQWLDDCLLLNLQTTPTKEITQASRLRVLSWKDSQDDIGLLLKVYRLMVSAHYRSRPSDLRALMENPDLLIMLAEHEDELLGVVLLNPEGGFDDNLCHQIFLGNRRPKGHLLAQMLTAQAGAKGFARLSGLRIQRIAIIESLRRRGIGKQLIEHGLRFAAENNYQYLGASFAFDSGTADFWRACGFRLAHVGYGQGKSSGNHSVAVVHSLDRECVASLHDLQQRIRQGLAIWFCSYLQHLDTSSVVSLLRLCGDLPPLNRFEFDEMRAFADGHKGFELCFVSLQKLVMQAVALAPRDWIVHPWLIEKVVQNRDWKQLRTDTETTGRKAIQNKLRILIKQVLQSDIGLSLKPDNIDDMTKGKKE